MKTKWALSVGVLALMGLIGVTLAEMQTAQDGQAKPAAAQLPELPAAAEPATAPPTEVQAPAARAVPSVTDSVRRSVLMPPANGSDLRANPRRTRGLYIRPDGNTVGRVNYIDRSTLLLVPVPNAMVSFLQDRKIVAQGLTDANGMFAVSGLTPWAVYSVTAASQDWVCMFSTVIRPYDHDADYRDSLRAPAKRVGLSPGWVNEIRFASLTSAADEPTAADATPPTDAPAAAQEEDQAGGENQPPAAGGAKQDAEQPQAAEEDDGTDDDYLDYEFHEFQLLPRDDFIVALRAGLFGFDVFGLPPGMPGVGGGAAGGGVGGGGGGGGGGGDLGAALLGAGIGAGIGAAIGAGEEEHEMASPFQP